MGTLVLTHFGEFLDGAWRAGRSIILSAERFGDPEMNIPFLAAALRGFETEIVVLHRPFFDWLRSLYNQLYSFGGELYSKSHPPISLEEFAADHILDRQDRSSVAVYTRYSQHFRNVT